LKAIDGILKQDSTIELIAFFTDDGHWVSEEICSKIEFPIIVISADALEDPAESWILLRNSQQIICSNSTFSITAAITSKAKVTLPKPLTKNTNFVGITNSIPSHWKSEPSIWE
jgi:hypothetical protein